MTEAIDIIIPVRNEQDSILKVLEGIEKNVHTKHIVLLIYDDEADRTLSVVKKSKYKGRVQLVKNQYSSGIVNALKTGIERSYSKYLVFTMADFSDDPRDIDKMVTLLQKGYDLVGASRYSGNGKRIGGSRLKGLMSFFACKTLKLMTGIPINDATNAFKSMNRSVVKNMVIESKGGFEMPLEITVKAFVSGKKISEVSTVWKERKKGKSKFKLLRWLPHYLRWYLYAIYHRNILTQT